MNIFALHAFVLALSVAWQAYIQDAPHLYITAAIALGFKAIVIPVALRRIIVKLGIHREIETVGGIGLTMLPGDWACCSFHGGDVARDGRRGPADARGSRLFAVRFVVGAPRSWSPAETRSVR